MRTRTPVFNEWLAFEKEAQALERKLWSSSRGGQVDAALGDVAALARLRREQARERLEGAMQELKQLSIAT
jgi:hypothetical protein